MRTQDGLAGRVFYFELRDKDTDNQLVDEVDGQKIPIILSSMLVVHENQNAEPKIVLPNRPNLVLQ